LKAPILGNELLYEVLQPLVFSFKDFCLCLLLDPVLYALLVVAAAVPPVKEDGRKGRVRLRAAPQVASSCAPCIVEGQVTLCIAYRRQGIPISVGLHQCLGIAQPVFLEFQSDTMRLRFVWYGISIRRVLKNDDTLCRQ
jgi:hypothetical protein